MESVNAELVANFRTVMAPFALLTSCATLAWSLQTRFSRVVDSIRTLSGELETPGPDGEIVREEMRLLIRRSRSMRNGLVGYYAAMMCFLGTAIFLMLTILTGAVGPGLILGLFVAGLLTVCWSLIQIIRDTTRSFDAVKSDLTRRTGPSRENPAV